MDVGASGPLELGEVDGELAGIENGIRGRIAFAFCPQDDVTSRGTVEVEEEILATGQPCGEVVVCGVAATDPDLQVARSLVATRCESTGDAELSETDFARILLLNPPGRRRRSRRVALQDRCDMRAFGKVAQTGFSVVERIEIPFQ